MIKSIKLETSPARAALIVAAFLCLAATAFFVKWCFADTIAAQAPFVEVAQLAVDLAPNDPQTHYALAVLSEKNFTSEELQKSLTEYEQATALSPNDYRLWLELGKARERRGGAAGAELALRKAWELAPHYAQVQWTLGNVLLRRGKTREAFDEIRRAAESNSQYRTPAIATAWQIYDGDLAAIKKVFNDSPNLNSTLAVFAAKEKRLDEAVEIWNSLPAEEKTGAQRENGETLLREIIPAKKYRAALQILTSVEPSADAETFAVGKIYNGGFESELRRENASVFDWQIADGIQPQIGYDDAQKVGGNRSLVIVFNSSNGKDFRQASQIVAVEAARKYAFEFFYKSELKTSATLRWEIVNVADDKILATTNPIANASDWTRLRTEFTTAANTEAVLIRLVRESCKSIICPITGKVWFDNFSIN